MFKEKAFARDKHSDRQVKRSSAKTRTDTESDSCITVETIYIYIYTYKQSMWDQITLKFLLTAEPIKFHCFANEFPL